MKILVAYFSTGGVTAGMAKKLAGAVNADLFEIRPELPYTEADLDWTNKSSRSSAEMENKAFRPALAGDCRVENMDAYDILFVGFPIWWYTAPTIINSFLEQYELNGKKLVTFASSGSSGMGGANRDLAPSCKGTSLLAGKRFPADVSREELKSWAEKFI